ncbi:MAG: SCO family protein [Hyphomicrobium aestuarii]|nr:SCO family protein [Hyphomicrobium aestuarii]
MCKSTSVQRVAAFVIALSVVIFGTIPEPAEARRAADYLPNVVLSTQDGQKVRFYDDVIKDKIVVFSFIYTSCMDICPLITARLAQVYGELGDAAGRDVHFVSISIDPKNDTPERLKRHADAFRSDPRWLFLTGSVADIDAVRYKLGERSQKITEHGSQIMIYNDRTGEWLRDSAFGDIGVLALTIRRMDPVVRAERVAVEALPTTNEPPKNQPGEALFAKACASCHAIGKGAVVGPNLAGLSERRERDWLIKFIRSPSRMHREKDPIALELAARYPVVRMPSLQLSESDVEDLLAYIEARSYAFQSADMKGPHRHVLGIPGPSAGKGSHGRSGHHH